MDPSTQPSSSLFLSLRPSPQESDLVISAPRPQAESMYRYSSSRPPHLLPPCPSPSPTLLRASSNPSSPITLHRPLCNVNAPPLLRDRPPRTSPHSALPDKILTLALMGFDTARILTTNPAFRHATLDSLLHTLDYLQSKGISLKETVRIVHICPSIITAHIHNDLAPVFHFLSQDLRVPDHHFHLVLNKCPRILAASARDQLKPALKFLRRLGIRSKFLLSYKYAHLLVLDVDNTLIPKLQFLLSIGFSHKEVEFLVSRKPDLLTSSIENNIKPKAEYFFREIKGTLEELREFPHYFTYCLEGRIKLRHRELVKKGIEMPLRLMLTTMDIEFRKLVAQLEEDNYIEQSNFIVV